ncbi:MAG: DUF4384 domain-containing protein [Anaeromyxobacteraceae bacterium]
MTTPALARAGWTACHSALHLDRWLAGALPAPEAAALAAHVEGCARCGDAVAELRAARADPLPPLRAPAAVAGPAPAPPRRRGALVPAAAAALAAAAAVLLVVGPGPVERTKGGAVALGMWVQHGGEVRRAGPGEAVAPGDAVRFSVTTPWPAYVAVLSVDAAGRASVYYPDGATAAPVAPGTDVALPLATRLDGTAGPERIVGLFCERAIALEPVRAGLEQGDAGAVPAGCQETRWSFVKR